MTWDIFCTVIDNFGDIGVTWRIARQLAADHGQAVRLWVDDLLAFHSIRPEIDPGLNTQSLSGVEIRRWTIDLPPLEPGEVVIEALACNLPDEFVARMAKREPKPLWLNLEYLTAENWARGVHGLPSPHPRLPLTKYFFMPGYHADSGGLTRESWLCSRRDAFQSDEHTKADFWAELGIPAATPDELRISMFCYENCALPGLLDAWSNASTPIRVLVPEGKALPVIAAWFGVHETHPGAALQRGWLNVHVLPMLDQDAYDRLLWACDLNFVRGEDSFVRAQFARRPLIWHAYRQEQDAHLAKLDAFLALYCTDLPDATAALARSFWQAWNRDEDVGASWEILRISLPVLATHAVSWADGLCEQRDLVSNLLNFFPEKVECAVSQ